MSKNKKVDRFTVKMPMYLAQVEFYICDDYEAISKLVPLAIKTPSALCRGMGACHFTTKNNVDMYLRPIIQMDKHCIATAAHETIHACTWILEQAGINPSSDQSETLA